MLDSLNHNTIANDVRMRRSVFVGAFILVEGRSDQRLYGKFANHERCQVLVAQSRGDVVKAVALLLASQITGVIGIVDADFDHLEQRRPPSDALFVTDTHDAETLVLQTESFEALLSEFSSPDKRRKWELSFATSIRDHILKESAKVGFLLWFSQRESMQLRFRGIKWDAFADDSSLAVDLALLIKHVLALSGHQHAPIGTVEKGVECIRATNPDLWQVVRGHDFMSLLSRALRHAIGSCLQAEVGHAALESHLRVSFDFRAFSNTKLYRDITAWSLANAVEGRGAYEFFVRQP